MYHIPISLVVIKAVMAFSAVFAAGIMFRRTHNIGWLVFVVWILLATSYIFEHFVDPFSGGGTPANMIPQWKRDWWSIRAYLDSLALSISVILIAVGRRNESIREEPNYLRIVIGWLVPALIIGIACTVGLPYLMFFAIGGARTEGFAAAGAGWFALLGGYIVTVIYIYFSLPGFAFSIIRYGDRESTTYMKKTAIVQILIYAVAASVFVGYITIIKAMKS